MKDDDDDDATSFIFFFVVVVVVWNLSTSEGNDVLYFQKKKTAACWLWFFSLNWSEENLSEGPRQILFNTPSICGRIYLILHSKIISFPPK